MLKTITWVGDIEVTSAALVYVMCQIAWTLALGTERLNIGCMFWSPLLFSCFKSPYQPTQTPLSCPLYILTPLPLLPLLHTTPLLTLRW